VTLLWIVLVAVVFLFLLSISGDDE